MNDSCEFPLAKGFMFPLIFLGGIVLSGCTQFPELDRAIPKSEQTGPYPALLPLEDLVAQTQEPRIEESEADTVAARAAALRARAARLKRY